MLNSDIKEKIVKKKEKEMRERYTQNKIDMALRV